MSFPSINSLRASGGLGGTTRQGPATFAPPPPPPGPPPGVGSLGKGGLPAPVGSSYTVGAGMQQTGRPPFVSLGAQRTGLNGYSAMHPPNAAGSANINGVVAGQEQPSAVGPEQQVQFDPNDPNNAALAGYMAAR